ncbi:YbaY family lipoprotein [Stutzerimonas azotifigens]|uniref:YbaY family lipoprotein n=1 Tax=Stutzerimonas azotifigens TaxID=291995 RepID=UPI00041D296E|nr:YbaY family lipoprotein [Stutzerimonas azotifigens]
MPLRPLLLPVLAALLAACAGPEPAPAPPAKTIDTTPTSQPLNTLSGSLLGVPAGAEVELALIAVDARQRPDRLLSSLRLKGRGSELPFALKFNPEIFGQGHHVELRGRVTDHGELIMRLPAQTITRGTNQALGPLQVVPAP